MTELTPKDIASEVGMSHSNFTKLPAISKWYYFYLVHYGPNSDQIKYLLRNK